MKRADLISLLYADGQTVPQIALQLGITQETARTYIKRRKQQLGLGLGLTKLELRQYLIEGAQ